MRNNIQIPFKCFVNVYKLILALEYIELPPDTQDLVKELETQINAKLDANIKRETYSKYKTAETPEEREKARQEYLDLVGMRESFRWAEGWQPDGE